MAGAGIALAGTSSGAGRRVRMGVIGTGHRGTSLTRLMMVFDYVDIPALCDINPEHLAEAQQVVTDSGRAKPEGYSRSEVDYKRMLERGDLDGVFIATPWEWHVRMAVDAMKAKI